MPAVASFLNALLLDVGPVPISLWLVSAFMDAKVRAAKEAAIAACKGNLRVWRTEQPMPSLTGVASSR